MQTHCLTKKYGEQLALDAVSLTLRQGDIYGLVSRNGAGKTTFFKCVMGLAKPTAGDVELCGLHRRETTLEEYFVRLVGGQDV